MIFAPVSNRKSRPEPVLGAPGLSWAGAWAYQVSGDGLAIRVNRAGHFRALLPSSFAASASGAIATNSAGALRARRY